VKAFGVAGLKGVESGAETVDFLAVTSETNFMTTMDDANDFFAATFQNSTAQLALWALSHPITSARLLGFASTGSGYDLTQHTFWPIAPLSLGTAAAKLRFAPCASNTPVSNPDEDSDTYLANNLQTYIATQSACWTVSAQLYVDDDSTPIEDTTVKWSAPWVDLATLTLTAGQDVWSSQTSQKMCEEISFNPWQTHPDNGLRVMCRRCARLYTLRSRCFVTRHCNKVQPIGRKKRFKLTSLLLAPCRLPRLRLRLPTTAINDKMQRPHSPARRRTPPPSHCSRRRW